MPMKPKKNLLQVKESVEVFTPPEAVYPLLPFIPEGVVWESSDFGGSAITSVLRKAGREVVGSHIKDGQDFFSYQPEKWDVQVTNPPYNIKDSWLAHSYELGKPFFLLLPVDALASLSRGKLYKKYGAGVLIIENRVSFIVPSGKANNWFSSMWLIGNLPEWNGRIDWIDINKGDKQLDLI